MPTFQVEVTVLQVYYATVTATSEAAACAKAQAIFDAGPPFPWEMDREEMRMEVEPI